MKPLLAYRYWLDGTHITRFSSPADDSKVNRRRAYAEFQKSSVDFEARYTLLLPNNDPSASYNHRDSSISIDINT